PGTAGVTLTIKGSASRADKALRRIKELLDESRAAAITAGGLTDPAGTARGNERGHDAPPASADPVLPRNEAQRRYLEAISAWDLVVAIGPAGTGKTFLAAAAALDALSSGAVGRIVLTRPIVEAGEKLGFLPGDISEKVHPFLRPLYDAFYALLGPERFRLMREDEVIETVPLAYMRGRTLEDAFVILDEAQNATREQMKMFLTRLGLRSKMVVTGDITQIDLKEKDRSGLLHAKEVLRKVKGVKLVSFSNCDVVRHPLAGEIVRAYEDWEKENPGS
ncbi:MAG TPA: PhoH family protein, partial [Elusimicrobiales bacterium]|nr:PhoH family protein [Elusimicrobiales bacterium]